MTKRFGISFANHDFGDRNSLSVASPEHAPAMGRNLRFFATTALRGQRVVSRNFT